MHVVRGFLTALKSTCVYICNLICLFHSVHLYIYTPFFPVTSYILLQTFMILKMKLWILHIFSRVILKWRANRLVIGHSEINWIQVRKIGICIFKLLLSHNSKYLKSIHLKLLFSSIFIIVPAKFVFVKQIELEVTMFHN